jgi:hypothetical protein
MILSVSLVQRKGFACLNEEAVDGRLRERRAIIHASIVADPTVRNGVTSNAANARTLDQRGEPGVITGKPAVFQAAIPPPMCAAWRCPAATRFSAAVNDRLPLPQ